MTAIVQLSAAELIADLEQLSDLLIDGVNSGAAIGFLPPLGPEEARAYWQSLVSSVADGSRILLAARAEGRVVGSVQLELATRANGLHRAEVQKMIVHTSARRQGLGRRLLSELEQRALAAGRSLLVLDTRQGEPSELLYQGQGYQQAGMIPSFARSADGSLHTTVLYYKLI
jgi:acetyltransferase